MSSFCREQRRRIFLVKAKLPSFLRTHEQIEIVKETFVYKVISIRSYMRILLATIRYIFRLNSDI